MTIDINYVETPSPQNAGGAASVIAGAAAGRMRVTGLSAMSIGFVGQHLYLYGSVNANNVGLFEIAAYVNATTVDVVNASAVIPDAGLLVWARIDSSSNRWRMSAAGDTKDSDNMQFIVEAAAAVYALLGVPADIRMVNGPVYLRKEIEVPDIKGFLESDSSQVTIVCGTAAGGPMDLLDDTIARKFNVPVLPTGFRFYGKAGGTGTALKFRNVAFRTNPSTNANAGVASFAQVEPDDANPWDNMACLGFVRAHGIIDQLKAGVATHVTAPDGSNKQTLTSFAPIFVPSDVGKSLTVWDSLEVANNGQRVITDYVDPSHVKFVNAGGALDATATFRWTIMPSVLKAHRIDLEFEDCAFDADYGDPVALWGNGPVSNINSAINFSSLLVDSIEGGATPPYTLNSPNGYAGHPNQGWEFRAYSIPNGGSPRYWWTTLAPLPLNGRLKLTNCKFTKCGNPVFSQGLMSTSQGYSYIAMPDDVVDVELVVAECEADECGLVSTNGASVLFTLAAQGGTILVDNIKTKNLVAQAYFANNPLRAIYAGANSSAGWIDPTSATLFGNSSTGIPNKWLQQKPPQALQVTRNDLDIGSADGLGQEPAFGIISINAPISSSSDPTEKDVRTLVAFNRIRGNAKVPIGIKGHSSGEIVNNHIEGSDAHPQIWVFGCTNVKVKDNELPVKSTPQIQLDANSRNCEVIDTLGQFPVVVDLGKANTQSGCVTSTNGASTVPDPWN